MTRIAVLGLGNWGTALGNHLAQKGFSVLGWSNVPEIVNSINASHINCSCLTFAELNSNLEATLDLEQALARDVVVMAFPSQALNEVVPRMKLSQKAIVVSAIKGLEGKTLTTPLQYFEKFGCPCAGLAVLSGPSFAKDIVVHRPSGVVAASRDEKVALLVADVFSSDWMKVYTSNDPLGVELGGILKNVIALAVGVCDGLEFGDSARAGLVTRGLAEMRRLAQAMGADIRTLSGLSGLGDLVMTSTCDSSRNRTVGLRLGKGEKLSDIVASLGSVAEGVKTTPHVLELSKRHQVEMPITYHVSKLLKGEGTPLELAKALISRPTRNELE